MSTENPYEKELTARSEQGWNTFMRITTFSCVSLALLLLIMAVTLT